MKPIALVTTLSLTVSTVWASGHVLARKAPSLHPRVSFQGGWPIQADTCPSNTTMCQFKDSCCPTGTNCYIDGLGGATACCPTTGDCSRTADTIPVCADPSWTLYIGNYYYFCCSSGQIGILPDKSNYDGAGLCVESGSNVASTALATLYSGVAAATGTSTVSDAASTGVSSIQSAGASSPQSTGASRTQSIGASSTQSTGTSSNPGTAKSNESARSLTISVIGMTVGFLLVSFGM